MSERHELSERRFWLYLWLGLGTLVALICGMYAPSCERDSMQVEVTKRMCIEHGGSWSSTSPPSCIGPKASK